MVGARCVSRHLGRFLDYHHSRCHLSLAKEAPATSTNFPALVAASDSPAFKMESRQNARPIHFSQPIRRVFKSVRVDAIAEGRAVHHDVNFAGSKEALHQAGARTSHTSMPSRILRTVGVAPRGVQFGSALSSGFPPPSRIAVTGCQKL